jgi:FAD/FMN-containing dehydrogenase
LGKIECGLPKAFELCHDAYVEEYQPEAILFPKTADGFKIMKVASAQRSITRVGGISLAGGSFPKRGVVLA